MKERQDEEYISDQIKELKEIVHSHWWPALEWLQSCLIKYNLDKIPRTHLYASPTGRNVICEWNGCENHTILIVNMHSHLAYWHNIEVQSNEKSSRDFHLDNPESWPWISEQVHKIEDRK